jgi:hypothetical protein
MDVRLYERGALFCDQGPHDGQYRVDFSGYVYLTPEEFAEHGHFTLAEEQK